MENQNQPLSGKKLFIFSLLFVSFMILVGYMILSKNNDGANINTINNELLAVDGEKKFDKGLEYYDQKNYVEASKYFSMSIEKGFPVAHALLGECMLHLKQLDSAQHHLQQALLVKNGDDELTGYYSGVEFNLGMVYFLKKENKLALEHLRKAKGLGNTQADLYLSKLPIR